MYNKNTDRINLRTEKVLTDKRKKEIKRIYTDSFSKEDRMPFWLMLSMSHLRNNEFYSFYDKDILCGFIYMATIARQSFIMFFAVDEKLRSKGYGSLILEKINSLYPKNRIILSIEPCDAYANDLELRKRRKGFYMRNGYKETGYFMKLFGKDQEILITNGEFDRKKFILFFMFYSNLTIIPEVWKIKNIS